MSDGAEGKTIVVEQYIVPMGHNKYALMSWAGDGRGCSWHQVRKIDSEMPCPNGSKGLDDGWIYEVMYGIGCAMERQSGRRFQ